MRRSVRQFLGWWLLIGTALFVPHLMLGQALELRWGGDGIHVAAPKLRFLQSPVHERLLNGAPVPVLFNLTVSAGNRDNAVRRVSNRVVVSYDLWEEKYSTAESRKGGRFALHKNTSVAEAWCLDQLTVRAADLPAGRSLYFRLDVKAEDPEADAAFASALHGLVDTFSRTRPRPESHWTLESGPVKLEEIRKTAGESRLSRLWTWASLRPRE